MGKTAAIPLPKHSKIPQTESAPQGALFLMGNSSARMGACMYNNYSAFKVQFSKPPIYRWGL